MTDVRDPDGEVFGAVIVAAGSGVRMDGLDKLFTRVAGRPLLAHTVAAFEECWNIDRIAVVLSESSQE
ncbi:MAG: 2-C-methyl-D-erythritol 4-phosphate cytidylyltransferase, partial [Dehalococcoidia bacterium]